MGSGTTLVEGLIHGGTTLGIDIDPLARFLAKAKVSNVKADRILKLEVQIRNRWRGPARRVRSPMPDIPDFNHWFGELQWGWLQALHDEILALECSNEERDFLLVVFSSILRSVSNADDQSQKTYVSATLPKVPPAVPERFWRSLRRAVGGLGELAGCRSQQAVVRVIEEADATRLPIASESVDLAVTSPPYLDSVDYPYNLMLEYFWLGPLLGVPDRKTLNEIRRRPVGAKHPITDICLPEGVAEVFPIDDLPLSRRRAVRSYFGLMERHFQEMARCLKRWSPVRDGCRKQSEPDYASTGARGARRARREAWDCT